MAKTFVVEHGALSLVDGEAKYKGDLVTEKELGDQAERHLKNKAIREATPAEVRAGKANVTDEPTLEQQIEDEEAGIEAAKLRIRSLEGQIKERDAREKKAGRVAEDGNEDSPANRMRGSVETSEKAKPPAKKK